jgi:hypothetical protein
MKTYGRFLRRSTLLVMVIFVTSALATSVASAIDLAGLFDWGLGWSEFWAGLGMAAFGLMVGFGCLAWYAITGFEGD